eukprot:CAMPEP_0178989794 /NCGR_PEP_ID=MMETSP0795-20121207/4575_1 /TAXON_ID=88552 /ORGANISM="Amoebophrya sp., Strain Ameob2" /LENGTH=109 /DNA_ID=CAMNT_0020681241 /DNA_START=278 /DNA_END=607 /DNA_ORIENTATION=-
MLARSRENKIAADSLVDTLNSASREIAEVISGKKDLRQSLRRELEDGKRQPLSGGKRPLLASKRLGALACGPQSSALSEEGDEVEVKIESPTSVSPPVKAIHLFPDRVK